MVEFGQSASINCSTSHVNFLGMGWEAPFGGSGFKETPFVTWKVNQLEVWDPEPFCYVTLTNEKQCSLYPNITVYSEYRSSDCTIHNILSYTTMTCNARNIRLSLFSSNNFFRFITETPDNVSIFPWSDEPMVEDTEFTLTCDIIAVAPEKNLIVKWYRGSENVNTGIFSDKTSVTPNNVTSTLKVIPKRSHNGIHFTCKAELHLGPNGPQPVPSVTSEPYIAVVHCEFSTYVFIYPG